MSPRVNFILLALTLACTASTAEAAKKPKAPKVKPQLEALNPELAEHPYKLKDGPRQFENRISFSPGYGTLGSEELYTFRLAYQPSNWLGYEASLGHNPGQSVAAVLHTLNALVRYPLSGRFQPYLAAGYGMMIVTPGNAINADPVTKNSLVFGGGLEYFIREDLALRGDVRSASVFGRQKNQEGVVTYNYMQSTIGLTFFRTIKP